MELAYGLVNKANNQHRKICVFFFNGYISLGQCRCQWSCRTLRFKSGTKMCWIRFNFFVFSLLFDFQITRKTIDCFGLVVEWCSLRSSCQYCIDLSSSVQYQSFFLKVLLIVFVFVAVLIRSNHNRLINKFHSHCFVLFLFLFIVIRSGLICCIQTLEKNV